MKVTLLKYTPNPERVVAMAARLCYSASGAKELAEKMTDEQVEKLVNKIIQMGHASTMEHVSFTFGIEGISRVLTHQLVRHRLNSYSQQSQRYVAEHDFEYILPPSIENNEAMVETPFSDKTLTVKEAYEEFMENTRGFYDLLVNAGVPKEDARYVLANATETKIVVTMNARSLAHYLNLRCCNRAQWEIRELAFAMLKEVKKVAPLLFKNAGASCVTMGHCPEGAMCCGKMAEVKEKCLSC